MVTINPICMMQGAQFFPKKVALFGDLKFETANEPGADGVMGRYKGKPTPFGAASLRFPSDPANPLREALLVMERILPSVRLAGASEIELYLGIDYVSQCNFEIRPEDLEILSRLKIPLLISCIEKAEP